MRVVIQRVSQAQVVVSGEVVAKQGLGFLILLGIEGKDGMEDVHWLTQKITKMRLFPDEEGVMNRSLMDVEGEATVVSQFTLHAKTRKGNRPSYTRAANPEDAKRLYKEFIAELGAVTGKGVQSGRFGAMMEVSLINSGPVTILLDSHNRDL